MNAVTETQEYVNILTPQKFHILKWLRTSAQTCTARLGKVFPKSLVFQWDKLIKIMLLLKKL
jgi:hypothetical protein